MSTAEILDALPRLSTDELQRIHQRILDLEDQREIVPNAEFTAGIEAGLHSLETEPTVGAAEVRGKISRWAERSA